MNKHKTSKSSPAQEKITILKVQEPAELMSFLIEAMPSRGRNALKSILARGQVFVDSKPVTKYNHPLQPGQQVSIHWAKVMEQVKLVGVHILHEDEDLIVIQKEAGLLSVSATKDVEEVTAYRQLMEYVRRSNPKNRIFVVHRLDRDTSGVMMFAKNEKTQQALQNAWQDAVLERSYIALVEGEVKKPEGTITSWLKESKTLLMYSSHKEDDGQKAITHYTVMQTTREFSLLQVELETGRKNQIRVHMKDIGHPVVGDKKYGSKTNIIGRLGLHARILAFEHPTTGKALKFESRIPEKFMRPFQK
ncbi:23S rRNA pseudouridine1911/1915/1917 synthase [Paenibacillus eucommiae]|uniref:Pseudouridine synthase n=2 Tax=Paenibacillus eucommiae TaxID=1355755 RepID=A0ABS4J242_9BACL|nr:RluA family pseudouridine synthase [Paenibacillus eucommiae]MBP1993888.1 23S rRNA pseudouridine1911/1915/1917 synthase [Paenibacillus eucommiae]